MNVGRFEEKGVRSSRTPPLSKNSKNYNMHVFGTRGNPRSSRRAGVIIITMKSGDHRRGLLDLYKTLIESEYLTKTNIYG